MAGKGRPVGSKNTPKVTVTIDPSKKPSITITTKDKEFYIIQKARGACRRAGDYGKSRLIAEAVWKSGSFESGNIQLAIKAVGAYVSVIKA